MAGCRIEQVEILAIERELNRFAKTNIGKAREFAAGLAASQHFDGDECFRSRRLNADDLPREALVATRGSRP